MYDIQIWTLKETWDDWGFGYESDIRSQHTSSHENYTGYGQWHLATYDYQLIFKNWSSILLVFFRKSVLKGTFK